LVEPFEGGLRLGDRHAALFLENPRWPPVGRIVARTCEPHLTVTGAGIEAAGSQCYPQTQLFHEGWATFIGVSPI
jgi:hypothetical protein